MSEDKRPRRKSPATQPRQSVKTSLIVATDLHARWKAAAALAGMDANAFAIGCLERELKGLLLIDRRKVDGRVKLDTHSIGDDEAA